MMNRRPACIGSRFRMYGYVRRLRTIGRRSGPTSFKKAWFATSGFPKQRQQPSANWASAWLAYSPLSRGLLSGEIKTPEDLKGNQANMSRFQGGNFYKNLQLVEKIKTLEENMAAERVQLTPEDLQSIEAIMPAGIVSGSRYPEVFMNALNR